MNSLEKQLLIKEEILDQTCFFQSLLQEAYRLKLLTEAEFENVQLQCIQLLARQTERYTGGESSSVSVETAESILQSIFYTIGISLKSFTDPDLGMAALKNKSLMDLFRHGKNLITVQFYTTKQLLELVQGQTIVTDNLAYNDTIQTGLPAFFTAYDIDFAAHDTPSLLDYPLSSDTPDLSGIEYMSSYMQKLLLENQFCQSFSADNIQYLLRGYDEHYRDLLINIFELVLINAAGCILAHKNPLQLNLGPSERQYIRNKLAHLHKPDMAALLQASSTSLCQELHISNQGLQKYIERYLINLPVRLNSALENKQLDSIFIGFKESDPKPDFLFKDGAKLDDELFRHLANEIRECRFVNDKIAIIKREIHSITDLTDILTGSCIFDTEFREVFQSLGDMELALLSKMLPPQMIDGELHFSENEKEYQNSLVSFLAELDYVRSENVRKLSKRIDLDRGTDHLPKANSLQNRKGSK